MHPFKRPARADVWRSPDGVNWEQVCDEAPWKFRFCQGNVVSMGGYIYLVGGAGYQEWTNVHKHAKFGKNKKGKKVLVRAAQIRELAANFQCFTDIYEPPCRPKCHRERKALS
mmetsp:Transcript_7789/g.23108  ORF Transcript_7789/g.23108 Transcript_7789/m.23108 type:complete len:113 (+) Transcript_7789:3-341(+)